MGDGLEEPTSDLSAGSPTASLCSSLSGLSLSPRCLGFSQYRPVLNHYHTSDKAYGSAGAGGKHPPVFIHASGRDSAPNGAVVESSSSPPAWPDPS